VKNRAGMTLIELLAASALAALLMVSILGVLRSLRVQSRVLLADDPVESWKLQLREQLQWDLTNARKMSWRPDRLCLRGYGGRETVTDRATLRPTEVIYSVREVGDRHWLVREEVHLDGRALHNRESRLSCEGVEALVVMPYEPDNLRPPEDPRRHRVRRAQVFSAVPGQVRLVFFEDDAEAPLMDEVFFLK
jgi:prepilin-type N-terminal cleavage/methylation domain-containing protein